MLKQSCHIIIQHRYEHLVVKYIAYHLQRTVDESWFYTHRCWLKIYNCFPIVYSEDLVHYLSEWLLFNVNSVSFQLYHGDNKLIFNQMMMIDVCFVLDQHGELFLYIVSSLKQVRW